MRIGGLGRGRGGVDRQADRARLGIERGDVAAGVTQQGLLLGEPDVDGAGGRGERTGLDPPRRGGLIPRVGVLKPVAAVGRRPVL